MVKLDSIKGMKGFTVFTIQIVQFFTQHNFDFH